MKERESFIFIVYVPLSMSKNEKRKGRQGRKEREREKYRNETFYVRLAHLMCVDSQKLCDKHGICVLLCSVFTNKYAMWIQFLNDDDDDDNDKNKQRTWTMDMG